jgi:hypothetical protein
MTVFQQEGQDGGLSHDVPVGPTVGLCRGTRWAKPMDQTASTSGVGQTEPTQKGGSHRFRQFVRRCTLCSQDTVKLCRDVDLVVTGDLLSSSIPEPRSCKLASAAMPQA